MNEIARYAACHAKSGRGSAAIAYQANIIANVAKAAKAIISWAAGRTSTPKRQHRTPRWLWPSSSGGRCD
jgi:hypothetical protein